MTKYSLKIGIIGGSGLDDPEILSNRTEVDVDTPYGKPSDKLICGDIEGVPCVLLARHGRDHGISPCNIPYKSNIWALKEAGCTHLLVSTACGSLREHIVPGSLIILDSFIDNTYKGRQNSFHAQYPGDRPGICHLHMGSPFNERMRKMLSEICTDLDIEHHKEGTVVTIEGPRFSSKAESKMYRVWGADVINMTSCPEVPLANEAGMLYASVAMSTDYDSWRPCEEAVTVEAVLKVMAKNTANVKKILKEAVKRIASESWDKDIDEHRQMVRGSIVLPHWGNVPSDYKL
eukprot:Nk52_evm25s2039 gene=Nk52_evmTU25s2039